MRRFLAGLLLLLTAALPLRAEQPPQVVKLHSAEAGATATGTVLTVLGYATVSIQVVKASSWDGTLTYQVSNDGSNYANISCKPAASTVLTATTTAADAMLTCPVGGYRYFKAPISSRTTGNVTVTAIMSYQTANNPTAVTGGLAGAPDNATYWTKTAESNLSAEVNMGALTTGLVLNTVSGGNGTPSTYAGTSCSSALPTALSASGAATCSSNPSLTAGGGTGTRKPAGVILTNVTSQATTGTSEETLATVTLPGGTLANDGESIRLTAIFTTAGNTNSKIARLRWNGTSGTIISAGSTASSGSALYVVGHVIRTGASAQILGGAGIGSAPNAATTYNPDTVTTSSDVVIYVRGLTATASGDLTFKGLIVEYLP